MSCLKNYKVIIDHSKTDGSIVWNYFGELSDNMGIIQPDKYFCAECLKNEQNKDKQFLKNLKCYSKSSSTGNLKAHLIERHKLSFTPKTPSKSDISKWFTSSPRTPILRKSDPELAESIFLMCARDLLPFQFVEKEGFKDFTNKYLQIEACQLDKRLSELVHVLRSKLKSTLWTIWLQKTIYLEQELLIAGRICTSDEAILDLPTISLINNSK